MVLLSSPTSALEIVSSTRLLVMRETSGASTNRLPSSVAMTMPSKRCSRPWCWALWNVPTCTPSVANTGVPRGRTW